MDATYCVTLKRICWAETILAMGSLTVPVWKKFSDQLCCVREKEKLPLVDFGRADEANFNISARMPFRICLTAGIY